MKFNLPLYCGSWESCTVALFCVCFVGLIICIVIGLIIG